MAFVIEQSVDLRTVNRPYVYEQALEYADAQAHCWRVRVMDGTRAASLAGMTATCYFTRPAGASEIREDPDVRSVTVMQSAQIDGNIVQCLFEAACYAGVGGATAIMRLARDRQVIATAVLVCTLRRGISDSVVDSSGLIPSLDQLLAQIEAAEAAAQAANDAAESANAQAEAASAAAAAADREAGRAQEAAAAARGWADATATAQAGEEAGVELTTQTGGAKELHFTLPRGETGATPDITFSALTGEPGTDVLLEQSGTAEQPHILLTIPRGDTGAIEGLDYYSGAPAALGVASPGTANGVARGNHVHPMPTAKEVGARPDTWTPTAQDVGARPDTWTPTAEDVGAYPVGSVYISAVSTSPASLFGGVWEQIKDAFLLSAGDDYAAGSTGGAAEITLGTANLPAHAHTRGTMDITGSLYCYSAYNKGNDDYWTNATSGAFYKDPDNYNEEGSTLNQSENADLDACRMVSFKASRAWTGETSYVGEGEAFSSMPPYLTVYMWKRVK